jgi:hypothetical protein
MKEVTGKLKSMKKQKVTSEKSRKQSATPTPHSQEEWNLKL